MSIEENKAVIQRIWKEILNEGKTEKADELVANDYAYHGPGGHEIKGIEGFKKFMTWIHSSFPGVRFTLDDLPIPMKSPPCSNPSRHPVPRQSATLFRVKAPPLSERSDAGVFNLFQSLCF